MKISGFKHPSALSFVDNWIDWTIEKSAINFEKIDVQTTFGRTRILAVTHADRHLKPVIYVPGARTCGIFLDLSSQLHILSKNYRLYLLDVVGQVGMSEGNCPNLRDISYGIWLDQVCRELEIEEAVFVGASFGGQIIIKLAAVAPGRRIDKPILMNPIGFSGH